jgi:hypothetical protein
VIAAVLFAAHVQRVAAFHDDKQRKSGEEDEGNRD